MRTGLQGHYILESCHLTELDVHEMIIFKFSTLKTETPGLSETLVRFYRNILRHILEYLNIYSLGSLRA
jgi:hypothetical protein